MLLRIRVGRKAYTRPFLFNAAFTMIHYGDTSSQINRQT